MSTKKLLFIFIPVLLIVAAAAFVGGRLLNGQGASLGFLPMADGSMASFAIDMRPAPELPVTPPDAFGNFAERADNNLYIQTFPTDAGGGGVITVSADGSTSGGESGPKVEVVISKDTKIYRDITEFGEAAPNESITVQQVVEPGSLDDLVTQTILTVWGRKNGDRIIADVILYSTPVMIEP